MKTLTTILLALAACNPAPKTESIDPTRATSTAVDEIPKEIPEYPAIIWTKDSKLIPNEVAAKVTKIYVKQGQHVKKGDLLLEISDEELKHREANAIAQIDQAKASAGAAYAEASNQARKARIQTQLYKGGAGTVEGVRDAQSSAEAAGSRGFAESKRAEGSKADLEEIRRQLAACKVVAEIDGEIAVLNAKEGVVPQRGQTLARIADTSDLRVRFVVPLSDVKRFKKGTKVNLHIENRDADIPATVLEFTGTSENHVEVAIIEADIDDKLVKKDDIAANAQGVVRIADAGGKS